jgi:type IV pilus assembly protein PilO
MEQLLDKIAKAPPAAKWGGVAGGVVAITILNFFLLIQPLDDQITNLEHTQVQLDAQLNEKRAIAQNLTEMRRKMDDLEQQLSLALTELPEKKDIDELLAQLNDVGRKSGLEISRIEPGAEAPATFYSRIPIKMQVSGNYHEIAMFLQEIANMRRIVNVNNLRLGSPTIKNDKVILTSDFLATTFRFLDPNAKKDAPKAGEAGAGGPPARPGGAQ